MAISFPAAWRTLNEYEREEEAKCSVVCVWWMDESNFHITTISVWYSCFFVNIFFFNLKNLTSAKELEAGIELLIELICELNVGDRRSIRNNI